jgi:cytoskeletal protein CcmA (bactofilin family)
MKRNPNNMSSTAAPILQMPEPRRSATIGKSVTVKGQIISQEDLTIDGEVEGSVELQAHLLTIGPSGKLEADVKARDIVVLGSIEGKVEATEKIDIKKQASITGEIKAARIVTEDGAYLKGTMDTNRAKLSATISNGSGASQSLLLDSAQKGD